MNTTTEICPRKETCTFESAALKGRPEYEEDEEEPFFFHFTTEHTDKAFAKDALLQWKTFEEDDDGYPPLLKECWLTITAASQILDVFASSSEEELPLTMIPYLPSWVDVTCEDVDSLIDYATAINKLFDMRCKGREAFDVVLRDIKNEDQSSCKHVMAVTKTETGCNTAWSWKSQLAKVVERAPTVAVAPEKVRLKETVEEMNPSAPPKTQIIRVLSFKGNCRTTHNFLTGLTYEDYVERTKALCLHELRKRFLKGYQKPPPGLDFEILEQKLSDEDQKKRECMAAVTDLMFFAPPALDESKPETEETRLAKMAQYFQRTLSKEVQEFMQRHLVAIATAASSAVQKSLEHLKILQNPEAEGYGSLTKREWLQNGLVFLHEDRVDVALVEADMMAVPDSLYYQMRKQLHLSQHLIVVDVEEKECIISDMLNGRPKKHGMQLAEHIVRCSNGTVAQVIDRKKHAVMNFSNSEILHMTVKDLQEKFGYPHSGEVHLRYFNPTLCAWIPCYEEEVALFYYVRLLKEDDAIKDAAIVAFELVPAAKGVSTDLLFDLPGKNTRSAPSALQNIGRRRDPLAMLLR
jgi:hypothetical protein